VRSLRLRLIAVLAAVVVTAMGVVFLYVVPTLRDNLINERLDRLEAVAHSEQAKDKALRNAIKNGNFEAARASLVRISRLANAPRRHLPGDRRLVYDTSVSDRAGVTRNDPVVRRAVTEGFARGRGGGDLVVAFRLRNAPGGVVALSQQVTDVNETADLVERRILIAAALALLVASLVGWAAAHAVTHRLARLERGATRISVGEFGTPIGDESPDELGSWRGPST